ncbi:MAG TPA: 50S ribosomal protein L25 [Candidatus Hydrogenedentes bacterium]|nr:50S ribosomal protein L25 [Candidatus Hydrogenedentota bacterium]HPG68556.1 50S ribosomal protein L25 [Candidatus Hydrogenedentota bacterium]
MKIQTLKVKTRSGRGTGAARKLRQAGEVPGILYGGTGEAVGIRLNARAFERMLHAHAGEQAVVQLDVEDQPELSTPALLKVVQHHPVRGDAIHADFLRIRLDERITTIVPIRSEGRPVGVADGGILDHQLREVEVECLALDVPEEIRVDVSALNVGDSLHVSEIVPPEGVTIVTDPARVIAAVHAPRLAATEEVPAEGAEEGAEAKEPELIGAKKDIEEEDE